MTQMGKHPMLDELARSLQHGPDGTTRRLARLGPVANDAPR